MIHHNLCTLCALAAAWGSVSHPCAAGGDVRLIGLDPRAPRIAPHDQRFLSRIARRACEQYLADESVYSSPYVPPALRQVRCRAVVTLRREGRELGVGAAGPGPIVRTTIEATLAALRGVRKRAELEGDAPRPILIEIEATGSEQRLQCDGQWLRSDGIDRLVEPGLDGLSVVAGGTTRRVSPAELARKNLPASTALKHLLAGMPVAPRDTVVSRFRSVHWYQPEPGAEIVRLRRGMTLVRPADVTAASIARAIDSTADYLRYRQQRSGLFAYEYEPATNAYSGTNDPVHQAGAAWALAQYAARRDGSRDRHAAERAVAALADRVHDLAGIDGAAFVASPDGRNGLGLTANVVLAMGSPLVRDRYTDTRARLAAGMLWLQEPSGAFIPAFPPDRHPRASEAYPGLVLSALVRQYRRHPTAAMLSAINNAVAFYRRNGFTTRRIETVARLLRPTARFAVLSNRKELADLSYRLADRLIAHQLTAENCPWPELLGGVLGAEMGVPDITTALCLSGWLDAMVAARRFGDARRAERYETAARRAVRFVLQLRVREAETYYMRSVQDALGGIRTSPADSRLRIQNLQYALQALMHYTDVLRTSPS